MEIISRKKRKPMGDINVVPYIDVMLVLLIVFMVTAPLLNQGIEVELPQANNEPLDIDENLETLVVSITNDGQYFLSVGATGDDRQSVPLEVSLSGPTQLSRFWWKVTLTPIGGLSLH
jgi:biopolymer transport protein ExbD